MCFNPHRLRRAGATRTGGSSISALQVSILTGSEEPVQLRPQSGFCRLSEHKSGFAKGRLRSSCAWRFLQFLPLSTRFHAQAAARISLVGRHSLGSAQTKTDKRRRCCCNSEWAGVPIGSPKRYALNSCSEPPWQTELTVTCGMRTNRLPASVHPALISSLLPNPAWSAGSVSQQPGTGAGCFRQPAAGAARLGSSPSARAAPPAPVRQ